jgi:hypothetical protein
MENVEHVRAALAALGAEGALGCRALPGLRFILEQRGPALLVGELKSLFKRPDFARALGSLSQALAPHLVTPRADSVAFWQEALDQIEEVCCLAESVYGVPVT